jgi:hypothetical protein
MQKSELRLIKNALEFLSQEDITRIPRGTRGIYVLYKQRGPKNAESHHYDFVYIGMALRGVVARLKQHLKYKRKYWSHFSVFEVWDNISDDEIAEPEGLFRHLYRFDSKANSLNKQKAYKKLRLVKNRTENEWL